MSDVTECRELLRALAAGDESSLRRVLAPTPEYDACEEGVVPALDRRTRGLVRLAALIALGASTESLQWAVEMAAACGVADEEVVGALVATGPMAGSAQVAQSAPRLALALGMDASCPMGSD